MEASFNQDWEKTEVFHKNDRRLDFSNEEAGAELISLRCSSLLRFSFCGATDKRYLLQIIVDFQNLISLDLSSRRGNEGADFLKCDEYKKAVT
jgi:hypothetical protein